MQRAPRDCTGQLPGRVVGDLHGNVRVAVGQGWSVLPAAGVAEDVTAGRLQGGPIADPAVSRTIVLALPRAGRIPPAAEVAATELVRVTRTLVEDDTWPTASVVAQAG